jgi:hypothetical protein
VRDVLNKRESRYRGGRPMEENPFSDKLILFGIVVFMVASMSMLVPMFFIGRHVERRALEKAIVHQIEVTYDEGYQDGRAAK